jgi:hypothetical protein
MTRVPLTWLLEHASGTITVSMHDATGSFTKRLTFHADGSVDAEWTWTEDAGRETRDATASAPASRDSGLFATELSLSSNVSIHAPDAELAFVYDIDTVARSERGFDRTRQGSAEVRAWAFTAGRARLALRHG